MMAVAYDFEAYDGGVASGGDGFTLNGMGNLWVTADGRVIEMDVTVRGQEHRSCFQLANDAWEEVDTAKAAECKQKRC